MPPPEAVRGLDAFGIATEARALGTDDLAPLMAAIGDGLAPHRPDILHVKICSTFDSAPETGNFAQGMAALSRATGIARQAILGGQPSLGRYCIFGHLFARAADGAVYRIDRHPVMRAHPVTPMTESDLAAHFEALGGPRPERVDRLSLNREIAWHDGAVRLFDALDADDVDRVGAHLRNAAPVLCAGASGVAEAMAGTAAPRPPASRHLAAPVLAFAGSRSAVSADQVARATAFKRTPVSPKLIATEEGRRIVEEAAVETLSRGEHTLLHLDKCSGQGPTARDLAHLSARLVAAILAHDKAGALVVAGGDTSSAILKQLAPKAIAFEGDIDRGVSLCAAEFDAAPPLPIVLKGGQVGGPTLFDDITDRVFLLPRAAGCS